MGRTLKDETGNKYGRLLVIERDLSKDHHDAFWICKCDCGNISSVNGTMLRRGTSKSCGCLQRELLSKRQKTHGETNTRIHNIWSKIKFRCFNNKSKDYSKYGGRGITMCEEWSKSYETFRDWSYANGYKENLTIDRIDNDGNYEPNNCRWATIKEQSRNTRYNRKYEYQGEMRCVVELAEIAGLSKYTLKYRLDNGYTLENAMFTPLKKNKRRINKNG